MTKEQINQLTEHVKKLETEDISFTTVLGEKNRFEEANSARAEYLREISAFLEKYGQYAEGYEWLFKENIFSNLSSFLTTLEGHMNQIKVLVKPDGSGVYDPNFPGNRQAYTSSIVQLRPMLKGYIYDSLVAIELLVLKKTIPNLQEIISDAKTIKGIGDQLAKEEPRINSVLEKIKDASFLKSIEVSKQRFDSLAADHKQIAGKWFGGMIASILVALGFGIYFYFWSDLPPLTDFKNETYNLYKYFLLAHVFKKLVVISVPIIAFRICLAKFNAEKNLEIIYNHRVAALKLFQEFESGLELEPAAKLTLRLEISKLLFSDPSTGYIKSSESDINFNPIVNMQEAIKGKIDGSKAGT
jgi:hypothetical protein